MSRFLQEQQLPFVIGHRGACGYAPENTLASFQTAKELGITWVEFDVRLTSCGEAVVIHDWNLERTSSGQGEVNETSYASLKELDAGRWFNHKFSGQQIPALKEVLQYLSQVSISINLEIKPHPGREQQTVAVIHQALQTYWPSQLPLIVSSFSTECLHLMRELHPSIPLGLLVDSWEGEWLASAQQLNCVAIHANHLILTAAQITQIKQQGYYLFAYTVNDSQRASELFALGVDAIFSDYPDTIIPGQSVLVDVAAG